MVCDMITDNGKQCLKPVYSKFTRCIEHCKYKPEYNDEEIIKEGIRQYHETCDKYKEGDINVDTLYGKNRDIPFLFQMSI